MNPRSGFPVSRDPSALYRVVEGTRMGCSACGIDLDWADPAGKLAGHCPACLLGIACGPDGNGSAGPGDPPAGERTVKLPPPGAAVEDRFTDCGYCRSPLERRGAERVCTTCGLRIHVEREEPERWDTMPPDVRVAAFDPENWFGKYVRLKKLGAGGMGVVYKGWDTELRRDVALKFVQEGKEHLAEHFEREARMAAGVSHPNIAQVYEFGRVGSRMYFAMQYVEGAEAHRAGLTIPQALEAVKHAARAVHFAHERGVIHRDLKPENLMVDARGHVYVTDFGLAKRIEGADAVTQSGAVGTPAYMAPEQALGRPVDRRCDVYGLGATLYGLVAGAPPHQVKRQDAWAEMVRKIVEEDPAPPRRLNPSVPREVEVIIGKAMEKAPLRRYGTAGELADDVERYLKGEPIRARPASWTYRARKRVGRNPWAWALGAAAITLLVVASAFVAAQQFRRNRERRAEDLVRLQAERTWSIREYLRLRQFDQVERFLQEMDSMRHEVEALDPENLDAALNLAIALRQVGRKERARELLDSILQSNPTMPRARLERGLIRVDEYEARLRSARTLHYQGPEALAGDSLMASLGADTLESRDPSLEESRRRAEADLACGSSLSTTDRDVAVALARLAELRGNRAEAERALNQITYEWAFLAKARWAEQGGRFNEALDEYERALDVMPVFVDALAGRAYARTESARTMFRCGDQAGALDAIGRALRDLDEAEDLVTRIDPNTRTHAWVVSRRAFSEKVTGELLGDMGDENGAMRSLERAVEHAEASVSMAPRDSVCLQTLASVHLALGHWRRRGQDPSRSWLRAVEVFDQALAEEPTSAANWNNRGIAHTALAGWQSGRGIDPVPSYQAAADSLERAVELNGKVPWTWNNLGNANRMLGLWRSKRGEDPTTAYLRARECLERAVKLDPSFEMAHTELGSLFRLQGDWEKDRGGDPRSFFEAGLHAVEQGLSRSPENRHAWAQRADLCARLGDVEVRAGRDPSSWYGFAIESATRSLEGNPQFAEGRKFLAESYLKRAEWSAAHRLDPTRDYLDAIAAYDAVLEIIPDYSEVWSNRGNAWLGLGQWKLGHGESPSPDYERAVESFGRSCEINPGNALLLTNLGNAWITISLLKVAQGSDPTASCHAAVEALDQAIDVNRRLADAYHNRGYAYAILAQWQGDHGQDAADALSAAIGSLDEAVRLRPNYWQAIAVRGFVYLSSGRYGEALHELEAAARIPGSNPAQLAAWTAAARERLEHGGVEEQQLEGADDEY